MSDADQPTNASSFDFLYVDYQRICSFLYQVRGIGHLEKDQENLAETYGDDTTGKAKIPGIASLDSKFTTSSSRGRVLEYGTYWHNITQFLDMNRDVNRGKIVGCNELFLTSTLSQLNILILFAINLKLHTTAFCFYRALLLFLFVFYCSSKFIRFCLNFAQHFCAASSCVPTSRPQRYKSPVVPA